MSAARGKRALHKCDSRSPAGKLDRSPRRSPRDSRKGLRRIVAAKGERLIWLERATCPKSVRDDGGIACTGKIVTARSLMSPRDGARVKAEVKPAARLIELRFRKLRDRDQGRIHRLAPGSGHDPHPSEAKANIVLAEDRAGAASPNADALAASVAAAGGLKREQWLWQPIKQTQSKGPS